MCTVQPPHAAAYLAVQDTVPDCIPRKVVVPGTVAPLQEREEHQTFSSALRQCGQHPCPSISVQAAPTVSCLQSYIDVSLPSPICPMRGQHMKIYS